MTSTTTTYRLPETFYDDHLSRDLPAGIVTRRTRNHQVWVELTRAERDEILSDARHYADNCYAADYPEIVASARRTITAIEKQDRANVDELPVATTTTRPDDNCMTTTPNPNFTALRDSAHDEASATDDQIRSIAYDLSTKVDAILRDLAADHNIAANGAVTKIAAELDRLLAVRSKQATMMTRIMHYASKA